MNMDQGTWLLFHEHVALKIEKYYSCQEIQSSNVELDPGTNLFVVEF